jgi:hypothetical protein
MRKARNNDHQRRGLIRDNAVIGSLFVRQVWRSWRTWTATANLYIFLRDGVSKIVTGIVSVKVQWLELNISIIYGISLTAGTAQSNYTCLWLSYSVAKKHNCTNKWKNKSFKLKKVFLRNKMISPCNIIEMWRQYGKEEEQLVKM